MRFHATLGERQSAWTGPLAVDERLRVELQLATVRGRIAIVGFLVALAGRIESPLRILLSMTKRSLPSVQVRLACL